MNKLYFVTGNAGKLREYQSLLPGVEQVDIDQEEIQSLDSNEIVKFKLQGAFQHHEGPFMVEEISLSAAGLNGLPGPFIKWFIKSVGLAGIAKIVASTGNMAATAKCVIGYARSKDDVRYYAGEINGQIVPPRGELGFGWDSIFQPDGYDKTFGEMERDEKNRFSMRRIAADKLKADLDE